MNGRPTSKESTLVRSSVLIDLQRSSMIGSRLQGLERPCRTLKVSGTPSRARLTGVGVNS